MNKYFKLLKCISNPVFIKSYIRKVSPLFELEPILKNIKELNSIIDIGSNKGQFVILAKKYFPYSQIYSFEPQKKYLKIQKKILGGNKIKYFNFGLGNKKGEMNFYITTREDSSSFLKPSIYDEKKYKVKSIKKIKIDTLDNILDLESLTKPTLIKLDVQGYELETLKGSKKTLDYVDYIITEVSYQKTYDKQVDKADLIKFLKKNNFFEYMIVNKTYLNNNLFQSDILYKKFKQ